MSGTRDIWIVSIAENDYLAVRTDGFPEDEAKAWIYRIGETVISYV